MSELSLEIRYEQLLGKGIDKAWKSLKTPEVVQEAHARKLLLISDGTSIAEAMSEMTQQLRKACLFLAVNDAPRDVHALYMAWLIATDLKSAISSTNLKIGTLRGAALTKSLFKDIATQVKIDIKAKVEPNGNYNVEDADDLMEQWFYFVFSKSIGRPDTRIVYDVHALFIEGKLQKPLYQPKKFVELSPKAAEYIASLSDGSQMRNDYKKKWGTFSP